MSKKNEHYQLADFFGELKNTTTRKVRAVRVIQDRNYKSDFEKLIESIEKKK